MSSGPPRTIQRNMVPVLARMFNNPEFSNLKILVNNDTFYAEKNFLRVSSLVWEVLLGSLSSTHRMIEYRIDRIRDSESILTILKFVYGVPINFTRLPDLVLLEVVGLADMLLYMEFHKDLLAYIDKHRPQLIGAELPPREETDGGGQVEGSGGQVVRDREQVEVGGRGGQVEGSVGQVVRDSEQVEASDEQVVRDSMQVEASNEQVVRDREQLGASGEQVVRDSMQVVKDSEQVEASGEQVVRDSMQVVKNSEQVEASGEQTESNSETARVTSELDNINLNSESDDSTQHYYVCNSEY